MKRRQEQLLQVDITHGLLAAHWKANRRPPVNGYRHARRHDPRTPLVLIRADRTDGVRPADA